MGWQSGHRLRSRGREATKELRSYLVMFLYLCEGQKAKGEKSGSIFIFPKKQQKREEKKKDSEREREREIVYETQFPRADKHEIAIFNVQEEVISSQTL
ncbi:hypothetical protein POVWA2_012640 [Plasmodium ovale wallikeri]|uniref:Uncharacterized protein n=1 Tax=Plasmodium ovale wallikeri TaxID=864142 RepID=A0A1A8YLH9_PLAOA|nr:hypothetical protein POVWA1_011940 [Plasmodium ovale wallikeri]SBT33040.1 hypothetical protein POVWA2_012640 [Plasmodium ovale wallikeri]